MLCDNIIIGILKNQKIQPSWPPTQDKKEIISLEWENINSVQLGMIKKENGFEFPEQPLDERFIQNTLPEIDEEEVFNISEFQMGVDYCVLEFIKNQLL